MKIIIESLQFRAIRDDGQELVFVLDEDEGLTIRTMGLEFEANETGEMTLTFPFEPPVPG